MSYARERSPYAGVALVLAMLIGGLFWTGVIYTALPNEWIAWPATRHADAR